MQQKKEKEKEEKTVWFRVRVQLYIGIFKPLDCECGRTIVKTNGKEPYLVKVSLTNEESMTRDHRIKRVFFDAWENVDSEKHEKTQRKKKKSFKE
jgi:hypothetical protein